MPNSFVHFSSPQRRFSDPKNTDKFILHARLASPPCLARNDHWQGTSTTTPCVSTCKSAEIHATATPTHAIPHCLVPERASLRLAMGWHKCNSAAGNWFCSRKQGEFHDCKQTARHSQFITNTSGNNWGMSTGHLRWIWERKILIVAADNILSVCLIDSICSVIGYWQLRWPNDMRQFNNWGSSGDWDDSYFPAQWHKKWHWKPYIHGEKRLMISGILLHSICWQILWSSSNFRHT